MKAVALLTVLALALAGCGGKDDLSRSQMEAHVRAALGQLEPDLGPGGAIAGADLSIPVDLDGFLVTLPLKLQLGTVQDVLVTGSFGILPGKKAHAWVYCSPDRLVLVTDGLPKIDDSLTDYSAEMRNLRGSCLEFDAATSELLGGFEGLGTLLANDGTLEARSFKQTGKKTIEATYFDHDAETTITLLVVDKRLELVTADAAEGELKVDFLYGERSAITPPKAAAKLPSPVQWSGRAQDERYTVTVESGEAPFADAVFRVYNQGASVPCRGGPSPKAQFALKDGPMQTAPGMRFQFTDNGDGVLGAGDQAVLSHTAPNSVWKEPVEVWDGWAGSSAHPSCSIPGPAVAWAIGGLVLLAWARRR